WVWRVRSGRGPRDDREGHVHGGAAVTESTLERMLAIFDVEPLDSDGPQFAGDSDSGGRQVVEGSQILAQSLVAASKALPGRTVRSAHALFVSVADPASRLDLTVKPGRARRPFASARVILAPGRRTSHT